LDDGQESYIDFEKLRRACPCALCKGEANVMVAARPAPQNFTPASFEMRRWEYVGGYAIQPHWADGHSSGLYSYTYSGKSAQPRLESRPFHAVSSRHANH